MSKEIIVPTLSTGGYLTDTYMQLAQILKHYFQSDAAQTILYQDQLKSLSKTYYLYIREPDRFASAVKEDIAYLLRRYDYPQIDSDSRVKVDADGYATAFVYISVIDHDGKRVGIGGLSQVDPKGYGKLLKMMNEYGEGLRAFGETT